jgi:nucleotide-binding universal stress UspA family protein
MILLSSVLVATDFGKASESALDYGRNLARAFGGNLHVLHVVRNVLEAAGAEVFPSQRSKSRSRTRRVAASVDC